MNEQGMFKKKIKYKTGSWPVEENDESPHAQPGEAEEIKESPLGFLSLINGVLQQFL